ncbi:MAG TPA: hypothetical protein VF610_12735, partial [Segetibacter sp.]
MQANEFEKDIQNKLESFELTPTGEVWTQVAARIEKEKKRRVVGFVWIGIVLLLLAGLSGWWLTKSEPKKQESSGIAKAETSLAGKKATIISN